MIGLDEKTKVHIESFLDNMMDKGDLLAVLGWVREETSISSFRDLALGYMIGGAFVGSSLLSSLSEKSILSFEDKLIIRQIVTERLPQFRERIERELNR